MTKQTAIDKIEVLEDGTVQVRQVVRVLDDDGSKIGERFLRYVLVPGQDVAGQPGRVQRIAQAVWTQAVVDAYNAAKAAQSGA
jgi:ribosomal protein L21